MRDNLRRQSFGGTNLMHRLAILALLIFVLHSSADFAAAQSRAGMIEKYGPVPEAILEPAESGESGGTIYSAYLTILESLGMARVSRNARPKACHANLRMVKHAVDEYNAGARTEIETYKRNVLPINSFEHQDAVSAHSMLVTAKFMRSPILVADTNCKFCSYGDLYHNGVIYCELHGAVPEIRKELRTISGYTSQATRERIRSALLILAVIIALFLVLLAFRKSQAKQRDHI